MSTSTKPKVSKYDALAQQVTDAIVADLEAGLANPDGFVTPWARSMAHGTPRNATTGKAYRGGNAMWFGLVGSMYDSALWATFKQWQSVGGQVRKGEKAAIGVYWQQRYNEETNAETGETETKYRGMTPRVFYVFNAAQVDGIDWDRCKVSPNAEEFVAPGERVDEVDDLLLAQPWAVEFGQNIAAYAPGYDRVLMPSFEQFGAVLDFYSTWAHESCHATGDKGRLERPGITERGSNKFGSEEYAREELVAEIGAALFLAGRGLHQPEAMRPDHRDYIANWLQVLKGDPTAIFRAASLAQKAVDFLDPAPTDDDQEVEA